MAGDSPLGFKEWALINIEPGMLVAIAIWEFLKTIRCIIFIEHSPLSILNFQSLRNRAFSDFWQAVSAPPFAPKPGESPPPLGGVLSLLTPHLDQISGVVLDLGPGTGHLTHYYPPHSISAIYGAEPNEGLHCAMRANAEASGLNGKYHILTCGGEAKSLVPALEKASLLTQGNSSGGVFDTIIAARVLCAIPDLKGSLKVLYGLLKPGGRLLLVEHVVNPGWVDKSRGRVLGRLLQVVYKPLWEIFVHCHIDSDTETLLMEVGEEHGGWESVDLRGRFEWSALPWVGGLLIKRR